LKHSDESIMSPVHLHLLVQRRNLNPLHPTGVTLDAHLPTSYACTPFLLPVRPASPSSLSHRSHTRQPTTTSHFPAPNLTHLHLPPSAPPASHAHPTLQPPMSQLPIPTLAHPRIPRPIHQNGSRVSCPSQPQFPVHTGIPLPTKS
jgi:hypothetical protein